MLKHKKRISVITLTIFLLVTVLSGFAALAADAPKAPPKGAINKPADSGSRSGGSSSQGEGEVETPVENARLTPSLDGIAAYNGTKLLTLSEVRLLGILLGYTTYAPSACDSINLEVDPTYVLEGLLGYTERVNKVIISSDSGMSSYEVDITSETDTAETSVPLNDAGEDTVITIEIINLDDDGERDPIFGSNVQTRTYTLTVHRTVAPWLEQVKVTGPAVPYEAINMTSPGVIAAHGPIYVREAVDSITLELDPKDDLKWATFLGIPYVSEWTTKTVITWNDQSFTDINSLIDGDGTIFGDFITTKAIPLNAPGQDTVITIKLFSNKGEISEYTVTVRHYLEVDGVAIHKDSPSNPPVGDDETIYMSEWQHALYAVTSPELADYPYPIYYDWEISDTTKFEYIDDEGEYLVLDPDSDAAGEVTVTVTIKDGDGAEAEVFATDEVTIQIGKIDVFVVDEPDFNPNGSYTATFGYTSTFTDEIDIALGSDNDIWSFNNWTITEGAIPPTFLPAGDADAFTINYLDKAIWHVTYEGYTCDAAKTYQSITLNHPILFMELNDPATLTAIPSFQIPEYLVPSGQQMFQKEIKWEVFAGRDVVTIPKHNANDLSIEVNAKKPGFALIKVSIKCGDWWYGQAFSFIKVFDDRVLSISDVNGEEIDTLKVKKNNTAVVNADIDDEDFCFTVTNTYGVPIDWKQVKWGFLDENEYGWEYIKDASDIVELNFGENNWKQKTATLKGLKKGTTTVVAYLDNNLFSKPAWLDFFNEEGVEPAVQNYLWDNFPTYLACIPNDRKALLEVTVTKKKKTQQEVTTPPTSSSAPVPLPPALETLDVTITVGSDLGIVNGQQVTLSGPTLLWPPDRALVDYGDIAKLIPGVEVSWDWFTQSVTFTKDDKSLTMKLNEIPADFDIPFINLNGRMVVPVRYVGNFFGATVDWIGGTLVVHMYK